MLGLPDHYTASPINAFTSAIAQMTLQNILVCQNHQHTLL